VFKVRVQVVPAPEQTQAMPQVQVVSLEQAQEAIHEGLDHKNRHIQEARIK